MMLPSWLFGFLLLPKAFLKNVNQYQIKTPALPLAARAQPRKQKRRVDVVRRQNYRNFCD